jgi:hypothetical protein
MNESSIPSTGNKISFGQLGTEYCGWAAATNSLTKRLKEKWGRNWRTPQRTGAT